jgi:hypothetical protein
MPSKPETARLWQEIALALGKGVSIAFDFKK